MLDTRELRQERRVIGCIEKERAFVHRGETVHIVDRADAVPGHAQAIEIDVLLHTAADVAR